jgi:hypothetical protein
MDHTFTVVTLHSFTLLNLTTLHKKSSTLSQPATELRTHLYEITHMNLRCPKEISILSA